MGIIPEFKRLAFMDYPDYRVGSDGSVWSRKNNRWGIGKWRMLKLFRSASFGHMSVALSNKNGQRFFRVHRLVLSAFVGPCPVGMEACHFPDRNPSNNHLENLRWDTPEITIAT